MEFDLRKGFPLLGLKFVPFMGPVLGELLGFLRGYTSAADFRALGCRVWDQNANEEPSWLNNPARNGHDDLGRIYGAQWRNTEEHRLVYSSTLYDPDKAKYFYDKGYYHIGEIPGNQLLIHRNIDQITELLNGLRNDPHGRRHVVSAWNPAELHLMALPPCHMFFQCYVSNDGHLDLKMYQRSADTFLGVPFNIASYAALMVIIGKLTGLTPRRLVMDFGDAHLYTDHLEKATIMISRPSLHLPELEASIDPDQPLESIEPDQFNLVGYTSHPAIKASMAV
jgi:thymidylate synthase